MSKLVSGLSLRTELEKVLPSCEQLIVASAFVSFSGLQWLIDYLPQTNIKVIIIGRFLPTDFISGASDLCALREAIKNGYEVRALSNLHAKIYQIDNYLIFNGSANLTGKGLSIVAYGNLEACTRIENCEESKSFIARIVESATLLDGSTLEKMEKFLEQFKGSEVENTPASWPNNIISESTALFVSDFPLAQPGFFVKEYELNQSLPFAQVESVKTDFYLAVSTFKKTKAYRWLKEQIKKNQSGRDLGFGQISKLLHDELADDPAPYRQEIKTLQANLYSYIKLYASDEIEIYMPGKRSEVLKLMGRENS
ncbi:phospholipase D family protein [Pseudoalteromonas ruthenica]|uniref:phospholipase D family protein n=1 Tax=Pseudoalteromonas ruthenica TaxID=151081 RepID=UPI00110B7C7C|nr:phospholipase D family protein [Pseudoalteromonas ruthenica]TMO90386.1 hypothetical protein CWC12_00985 [Pseudoalteromonas ruthenica]TMP23543.1 hypothetical protein CWC06_09870 [Pseudoalteromonas ruthenica]